MYLYKCDIRTQNQLETSHETCTIQTVMRHLSPVSPAKHVLIHKSLHICHYSQVLTYLNYCVEVCGNTYTFLTKKAVHKDIVITPAYCF